DRREVERRNLPYRGPARHAAAVRRSRHRPRRRHTRAVCPAHPVRGAAVGEDRAGIRSQGGLAKMIKAAIIGLGRWGQNLVNSAQDKSDAIRFVAGATRTPARVAAYAREKGFPLHDSYDKALADPNIDAVVLATPHTQHARQIVAAARAGKHVFTEKPLAL